MDILSFNRISKPHMEVAAEINMAPKAKWFVEVMDTDGTVRPAGPCVNGEWIDNMVVNSFKDAFLASWSGSFGSPGESSPMMFASQPGTSLFAQVGTSSTPVSATQTSLVSFVKQSNTPYSSGNGAGISSTTGNATFNYKVVFSTESSSVTYYEAGLNKTSYGSATWGFAFTQSLFNRVLIPGGVTVPAGQSLVLTCSTTIPTLAVTGQTVTLSAQNGMNISGTLKLIGTTSSIVGGTVAAGGGTPTWDNTNPLFTPSWPPASLSFGLTTASSFPAFNSNTTGMNSNPATTTSRSPYNSGTYYRDVTGSWNSAYSVSSFQSICLSNTGVNGYQLLLNNPMSKATGSTLNFALRFAIA